MNKLSLITDRLRLTADLWLHRHGPWWLVLAGALGVLLSLAVFMLPRLASELAEKVAILSELQVRVASSQEPAAASLPPASASVQHYAAFRQMLADDQQVLPSVKEVLDAAERHNLVSTRAEYARSRDANTPAETLQMTVPVNGRYRDVRRWIEEILVSLPFVAVNELSFKREEIGLNQIEAKVRLTIWHRPAAPASHTVEIKSGDVAP